MYATCAKRDRTWINEARTGAGVSSGLIDEKRDRGKGKLIVFLFFLPSPHRLVLTYSLRLFLADGRSKVGSVLQPTWCRSDADSVPP